MNYSPNELQTKGTVLSVYKPKEPSLWFEIRDFVEFVILHNFYIGVFSWL